ncbi:MAG: response regulator [Gemmataceae bacterium]
MDDEPAILSVISKTLEQTGFRTVAVDSAEKAMDAFYARGSDPFHLVVADVVMPGMSGTEFVRKILRVDPQVRVLFISGQVTREITDRDFSIYGFDLLPTPFSPDQLILAVRGAIEKSRSALVSPTSKGQVEKEVPRTGV